MSVLNIICSGNEIVVLERRISFEFDQLDPDTDGDFWSQPLGDTYDDYIYCVTPSGLNTVKLYLDGKGYSYGADEDLTPASGVQDWLNNEQARGRVGIESKSDIYDKLVVDFPAQVCIDARE